MTSHGLDLDDFVQRTNEALQLHRETIARLTKDLEEERQKVKDLTELQRHSTPIPPERKALELSPASELESAKVNLIRLSQRNFPIWKACLEDAFKLAGLYNHLIDEKAAAEEPTQELRAKLKLISSLDEKTQIQIQGCGSAMSMMQRITALNENYTQATVGQLMIKFFNEPKQKNESMGDYLSKLEFMRNELAMLGQPQSDEVFMSKVLSTLPRGYETFKEIWNASSPGMKNVQTLISRLIEKEEEIRKTASKDSAGEALRASMSIEERKKRTKCAKCGHKGHWAKECSTKPEDFAKKSSKVQALRGLLNQVLNKDKIAL